MYAHILYDADDGLAIIRLNDPDTLNAMTAAMGRELADALDRAGREARAIVLGSVGRAFCSGANLVGGALDLADPERDAGLLL